MTFDELWATLEKTEGISRMQKMGKRAVAFKVGGTQYSVYVDPLGEKAVLFCQGNKIGTFTRAEDIAPNLQTTAA